MSETEYQGRNIYDLVEDEDDRRLEERRQKKRRTADRRQGDRRRSERRRDDRRQDDRRRETGFYRGPGTAGLLLNEGERESFRRLFARFFHRQAPPDK